MTGTVATSVSVARAGLAVSPARTLTAVGGMAAALGLVAGSGSAGRYADACVTNGVVLAAVVAAATGAAVDRRQLRAAAVVHLLGARPRQRRLTVAAEAVMVGLAALGPGLALGALAGRALGSGGVAVGATVATATLVPAALGLVVGRLRRTVTVLDAQGPGPRSGVRPLAARLALLLAGGAAVVVAAGLGASASDFFMLDLLLWPALALAAGGLLLAVPVIVDGAAGALARLPGTATPLAGALLARRRRLVSPAAALGACAALVVTVNAVLGLGLARREEDRRARLTARYQFTTGLGSDQLLVNADPSTSWLSRRLPDFVADEARSGTVPDGLVTRVRAAFPGAHLGRVLAVPATAVGDPTVPAPRSVGVATPELLAALGLERRAGDLVVGRALALDPTVVRGGRVELAPIGLDPAPGDAPGNVSLPAVVVQSRRVPRDLPAVLLAPDVAATWWRATGAVGPERAGRLADGLVVGLPGRARRADLNRLLALVHATPHVTPHGVTLTLRAETGDAPVVNLFADGRLDGSGAVAVQTPTDVRVGAGLVALVSLVALFIALRLAALTGRAEEDLLEVVGAPATVLRRVAAWQAAVLSLVAVPAGTAVGLAAVHAGIDAYNATGRRGDPFDLPPIPFVVPPVLLAVTVAVPLVAVAGAWLAAGRRPAVEPAGLADRLAW
ncbi:MAG TPA: FtsX-like permease family protein [Acidimicrobiales bacterium]|nr:FtsX-like permease family protein [Acidimicrobiales bacterium]